MQPLFVLPDDFQVENAEGLIVQLPQKVSVPLKTVNLLEKRSPRLKRNPLGASPRALGISTSVETWLNALLRHEQDGRKLLDWGALIGKLFLEGACAIAVLPSQAHFERSPDFIDTVDPRRYERLPKDQKKAYRPTEDGRYEKVDADGVPVPHKRYLRDAKDRAQDDEFYRTPTKKGRGRGKLPPFVEDRAASRKAFEEEKSHYLASRVPLRTRIISATDAIPIFGPGEELYGLVERSSWTEEALIAKHYSWDRDPEGGPALARGDEKSSNVVLYSYFGKDDEGHPFVAYEVEGAARTSFLDPDTGEESPAVVDLYDELGICSMPVRWCWGLHLETDQAPKKGIPYLWPSLDAITTAEAFLSMKAIHAYQHAFSSWAIEANHEIVKLRPEVLLENGVPRTIKIAPMTAIVVPGAVRALAPPNVGNDANDVIKILMQASASMSPSESAFGGGGAASGHDRSLAREYLETGMFQVMEEGLRAVAWAGSRFLELAVALEAYYGEPVPVYADVPIKQAGLDPEKARAGRDKSRREPVTLDSDWVGAIYDCEAFYPKVTGENLALGAKMAQDFKDGLATFAEYREKVYGDEAPEWTQILIMVDQWLRTDEGRARIAALAADMIGEDLEEELMGLVEEERMTPEGIPVSALPDELVGAPGQVPANSMIPPGTPQAPGPAPGPNETGPVNPGMAAPDPLRSRVGGTIAGEMETASIERDELGRQALGLG
jgi:hypothetical protein